MRRLAKLSAIGVATLLTMTIGMATWFDTVFVRPVAFKARAFIAQASAAELNPSFDLLRLLEASDGGRVKGSALTRRLLYAEPSQVAGFRTTQRQFVELGVSILIGLHLNDQELTSARIASAYLGVSTVGFERASVTYFNTPLGSLSREQLAELVALERVPSAGPKVVERVKQMLLSRTT